MVCVLSETIFQAGLSVVADIVVDIVAFVGCWRRAHPAPPLQCLFWSGFSPQRICSSMNVLWFSLSNGRPVGERAGPGPEWNILNSFEMLAVLSWAGKWTDAPMLVHCGVMIVIKLSFRHNLAWNATFYKFSFKMIFNELILRGLFCPGKIMGFFVYEVVLCSKVALTNETREI